MMGNRLTIVLLVLAAVMGALLVLQGRLEPGVDDPIEAKAPLDPPPLPPDPSAAGRPMSDLAALTETVDRPLFNTDRRPVVDAPEAPEPVAAPVVVAPERSLSFELSAVVILEGRRMALFQGSSAGGATLRAEEGELVEGWTLSQVRSDGVTLERNGESRELALRTFKPAPQRAAAVREVRRPVRRRANEGEAEQQDTGQQDATAAPGSRTPLRSLRRRPVTRQQPG